MSIRDIRTSVERYAAGKTWYWYVPLWLLGCYAFFELFQLDMVNGQMPLILIVPYSFNFLLHEVSHIVTAFLPPVLTASAGSASEILLGLALIVMAIWQRSYVALLFCALWFALACQSAGQYMADAVPLRIPLVSLGGALSGQDALHDWHFVFGQLHLLPASGAIGMCIRILGMLVACAALVFTAWVLIIVSRVPRFRPINTGSALPASSTLLPEDTIFTPRRLKSSKSNQDDAPPPGARDSFS